jgi:hypothetical protein
VQSRPPMHANRSVISRRANVGFIPATGLTPRGLAGCSAVVPWQATSPLFQSPRGEPFGPSVFRQPRPTTPFADLFLAVRGNRFPLSQFLPHAESQGTRKISRGKTQNVPRVDAEFIKHTPTGRWRTSRSRARSSRVYHTSDPVRIPRPALLDWASFRPHLTMTPLPFS